MKLMKSSNRNIFKKLLRSGCLPILLIGCSGGPLMAQSLDSLDVNQLTPKVHANGLIGQDTVDHDPGVTYGNDSSGVLFAGGLWMTAKGPMDSIHASCQQYIGNGYHDYDPGPIADQYGSNYQQRYDRVWSLSRDSIEYHVSNWWKSGYQVPDMISDWPAHGDTTNGEAWHLAPFKDLNDNGVYEPQQGDHPIIRGDRAIYFISNDIAEQEGAQNPMGIEVHGMLYAWDCPDKASLNNSILLHYEVINRSSTPYDSVMTGHFNDFDIGCANDDYYGSDVQRGIAFCYNGDGVDQSCNGIQGYDSIPPAFGVTFLEGPELDPNNTDDVYKGDGRASVTGPGFGDGITDNEHWGMERAYVWAGGSNPYSPQIPREYDHYMTGRYPDGTLITYDGTNPTRFTYPWSSDPQYFATYGDSIGFRSEGGFNNSAGERKTIASSGPTSLNPGDTVKLDMAYLAAQTPSKPGDSVAPVMVMKERVDSLRSYFMQDAVPCSDGSFSSIAEKKASAFEAKVFPNPSDGRFHVSLKGKAKSYKYRVYSMRGELLQKGEWNGNGRRSFRLSEERSGVHFLRIRSGASSKVLKVVKR